jgi:predicted acetyltransferase
MNYLPSYVQALRRAWSPNHLRPEEATEELRCIERDPNAFLTGLTDLGAAGATVTLPDGSQVPRLPGYRRWMWDGEFCGVIGLRWQPGTVELPPYYLGHIGYSVVPWKRRLGYASAALAMLLPEARARGLPYVELTADIGNVASQRVIEASGGVLLETFKKPAAYGGSEGLRYRIEF